MANKEAIVFAIDVSQSMGKPVSDEVGAPTGWRRRSRACG